MFPSPRLVSSSPRPPRFLRFGPFELDVRAGELRKHGTRLRLRTQTLQILLILLEHPGEVVLREEIRQQLWPGDTTVEFDHGINAAVQKLRDTLGESADNPRYIETLPRRGYRFLGGVERVGEEPVAEAHESGPALVTPIPVAAPAGNEIPTSEERSSGQARRSLYRVRIATAIAIVGLVGLAVWLRPFSARTSNAGHGRNFSLPLGVVTRFALVSPDGASVLYRSGMSAGIRRLDSFADVRLDAPDFNAESSTWSPDSSEIAYRTSTGRLIRRQVAKGLSATVCSQLGIGRGASWGSHGNIVIAVIDKDEGRLLVVPASGGTPVSVEVPTLPHGSFFQPEFLPNGEDLLFAFAGEGDEEAGLYLATLQDGKVTRGPVLLRKNITAGHYSPAGGGHLLYVHDDNLFAQKLDSNTGTLQGEPQRIVEGVLSREQRRSADFSVSRNGVLIWRPGKEAQSQLTWFDRKGKVLGTAGPPGAFSAVSLSPDEKHLLVTIAERRSGIVEAHQSSFLPLPGIIRRPVWMPDSVHIAYCRWEPNQCRLMEREAAGGRETELARLPEMAFLRNVSLDGNFLLYSLKQTLHTARIAGSPEKFQPELALAAFNGDFSPDGRWIAYTAFGGDRRRQVFVQPFRTVGLPTQVSSRGGSDPEWRADGKEIFFANAIAGTQIHEQMLYSVRLEINGNEIHASPPEGLFRVRLSDGMVSGSKPMAVTRDGSRILFAQSMDEPERGVNVMTAWDEHLSH
jgi:DNA-binding winged helix-turn-helix (wHTH) protein/Tol biopolymer transport system component